jgi:hypothetical protein
MVPPHWRATSPDCAAVEGLSGLPGPMFPPDQPGGPLHVRHRLMAGGVYGKANGPGPWHLVLPDLSATVCGVTRFHVTTYDPYTVGALCIRCVHQTNPRPGRPRAARLGPVEAAAARDEVLAACTAIQHERERLGAALSSLAYRRSEHLDLCMFRAYQSGVYSLEDLAELVGLTKERVRQRVRDYGKGHPQ